MRVSSSYYSPRAKLEKDCGGATRNPNNPKRKVRIMEIVLIVYIALLGLVAVNEITDH